MMSVAFTTVAAAKPQKTPITTGRNAPWIAPVSPNENGEPKYVRMIGFFGLRSVLLEGKGSDGTGSGVLSC